jgi:outer membrane protein TolC
MTQLVAGVSQMYPRGDSRRLKRQQLQQQSAQQPLLRSERQAQLTLTITQLWLDAYQARQSIKLIERDRALFDQLVDISLAGYSSALGLTRQQDLIKAQLEQTRIEDRLVRLLQKQEVAEQRLLEWLLPSGNGSSTPEVNFLSVYSTEQPIIASLYAERWKDKPPSNSELASIFIRHPSVQKIDQSIAVAVTAVRLAKQKYKPQWGMNASYGFRGEDASGRDRADLFSVGVTVSMPLFSTVKQDREVDAATASQEKVRTDRSLMIRQMIASFHSARTQLERLEQRRTLYDRKLIPQIKQQIQASLHAYESDNGSFIEVLRPRIDELNAQIEYLQIKVAKQKQIAQLNYFLSSMDSSSASTSLSALGAHQ